MPGWMLLTALLSAPAQAEPAPVKAPPPTAWALAGARGWRLCQEAERQARALRVEETRGRGTLGVDDELWPRRAEQCPHAVEVLTIAARGEIVGAASLFTRIDAGDAFDDPATDTLPVQAVIEEHGHRVEQALHWLDAAIAEAGRRRERPPKEALYYRAYALTALGRIDEARRALHDAVEAGDVERWRSERMGALIELLSGDIDRALVLAQRGVVDAAPDERTISRFIWALVLDRAGAPAVARAELVALHREAGSALSRSAMESVLPIHERLFFRALDHQAAGNRSPALRLWTAYLERPEPEAPERVLAQRHLDELTPSPARVGGP